MPKIIDINVELPDIDLDSLSTLKISINKNWDVGDFSDLLYNIDLFYKSKFWIYKAIRRTKDFISDPNNKSINFMHFAHTPLARDLDSIKMNLRHLETEGYEKRIVLSASQQNKMVLDNLLVKKISYASPGFTDVFGISGILKEIKETLTYYLPNRNDKEKMELAKQQRIELQIKNLKSIGFTDIEIRTFLLREDVAIDNLSKFIERGMIDNVEIVDNNN